MAMVIAYGQFAVTLKVDMSYCDDFNPETDKVLISADFAGWQVPGSSSDYMLQKTEPGSAIHSISLEFEVFQKGVNSASSTSQDNLFIQ